MSSMPQILADFEAKVRQYSIQQAAPATWGSLDRLDSSQVSTQSLASLFLPDELRAISFTESSKGVFALTPKRIASISFASGSAVIVSERDVGAHDVGDHPWIGFVQERLLFRYSKDTPGILSELNTETLEIERVWVQKEDDSSASLGLTGQDVLFVSDKDLACIRVSPSDGLARLSVALTQLNQSRPGGYQVRVGRRDRFDLRPRPPTALRVQSKLACSGKQCL